MLSQFYEEIFAASSDNLLVVDVRVARIFGRDHIFEIGLTDLHGQSVFQSFVNPGIDVPSSVFRDELFGVTRNDVTKAPALADVCSDFCKKIEGKILAGYALERMKAVTHNRFSCCKILDVRGEFSTYRGEFDAMRGRLRRYSLSVAAMYFEGFEPCAMHDEYLDPNLTRWLPLRGEYSCGSIYRCRQVLTVMRGIAATALGRTGYRMCAGMVYNF